MPFVEVFTETVRRSTRQACRNSIGYDDEHRNRPPNRSCKDDRLGMVPHSAWNLMGGRRSV